MHHTLTFVPLHANCFKVEKPEAAYRTTCRTALQMLKYNWTISIWGKGLANYIYFVKIIAENRAHNDITEMTTIRLCFEITLKGRDPKVSLTIPHGVENCK